MKIKTLEPESLVGNHLGRAWRATYVHPHRFLATGLEAESTPGDWVTLRHLSPDSWPTERAMRWRLSGPSWFGK